MYSLIDRFIPKSIVEEKNTVLQEHSSCCICPESLEVLPWAKYVHTLDISNWNRIKNSTFVIQLNL